MLEPWWPLVVLAVISAVDAVLCWRPVPFIATCLTNMGFPRPYWRLLTPIKAAAALGLLIGIWVPALALLTAAALVGYFAIAIGIHVRARDFGRNLFLNAAGMMILCVAELIFVISAI
ncbi:DoxX-like family protein [Microlunatus soli]|uniref:DoxX-like family protein n=1 Tax=Microlunatus soli TaxID=630515 RepID=A0A1H1QT55_9ACTN|nr:DoxX-like family protein [Microlunatus soli]